MEELNLLKNLAEGSTNISKGDGGVQVAIAFRVEALGLSALQKEIYALKTEDRIVVKIKFDAYYMGGKHPIITEVGKISPDQKLRVDVATQDFLVTWTVKERLQNVFIKGQAWPPKCEDIPENLIKICSTLERPVSEVSAALKKFKNSEHLVMSYFWDEKAQKKEPLKIASIGQCNRRLLRAIKKWNGIGVCNDTDDEDEDFSSKPRHEPELSLKFSLSMVPISYHIEDMWYTVKHNWYARLILFAAHVILTTNQTCMICDGPLSFVGLKPSACNDEFCQFKFCNLGLGFSLSYEIMNNRTLLEMFISMMSGGLAMNRIELCFPKGVRSPISDETFLTKNNGND
eukprot:UN32682